MDKQELRYLIKCKRLPCYNISKLVPIWDEILKEYEKLTNSFGYTNMLRKISWDAQKTNRLNGLISCFYLLKYKSPEAELALQYWGITNNSPANLQTIILREKTRLNIDALRNKKQDTKSDFDFDRMLVQIQNSRERDFSDIDKISVKTWVYECKAIEERVKQLESLKNGRPGQNNSR
jgi:hypothetical protein